MDTQKVAVQPQDGSFFIGRTRKITIFRRRAGLADLKPHVLKAKHNFFNNV